MEKPPLLLPLSVNVLLWLGLWGGVVVWGIIIDRLRRGRPVLRVEPRHSVPWRGIDLLAIFLVHFVCGLALLKIGLVLFGPEATRSTVVEDPTALQRTHGIVRLLSQGGWPTVVACVVMAVVVAPVAEEILFRLFLQGWLEKVDRRWRPRVPALGKLFRSGTLPVLSTSVLFALLHYRGEVRQQDLGFFLFTMSGGAVVTLFTVAVALGVARWVRGATPADLGFVPERFPADVGLGLAGFAAVAVPIYGLQLSLHWLFPPNLAPDPFVLFFFALVLGTLYLRTHRIVPSIVTHMALNASSLLLLWLMLSQ